MATRRACRRTDLNAGLRLGAETEPQLHRRPAASCAIGPWSGLFRSEWVTSAARDSDIQLRAYLCGKDRVRGERRWTTAS